MKNHYFEVAGEFTISNLNWRKHRHGDDDLANAVDLDLAMHCNVQAVGSLLGKEAAERLFQGLWDEEGKVIVKKGTLDVSFTEHDVTIKTPKGKQVKLAGCKIRKFAFEPDAGIAKSGRLKLQVQCWQEAGKNGLSKESIAEVGELQMAGATITIAPAQNLFDDEKKPAEPKSSNGADAPKPPPRTPASQSEGRRLSRQQAAS